MQPISIQLGINPIVAIAALIAGSQLFGVIGAFLGGPVAGVIQTVLVALRSHWKENHPEQFLQKDSDNQKPEPAQSSSGGSK